MKDSLDREQRLLALLLAKDPAASPFSDEFSSGTAELDWNYFEALVLRHRVAGLVHAGFAAATQVSPPADLIGRFGAATTRNAQNYMRAVQVANRLTSELQATGIVCAVLKGFGIAAGYYEQSSQREMIDIDILVDAARYEDAERIVKDYGFEIICPKFALTDKSRSSYKQLSNGFAFIRREDGVQIDLHWRMVQNPALLPWMDENWTGLLEQNRSAGLAVPMLRPAPHFLYIMAHGMKSGWVRLKWLVDVDRVVRGLTAEEIEETAELIGQSDLGLMAAASLCLSQKLLGTPLSPRLEQLVRDNDPSRLIELELPMIFGPMPSKTPRLKDWRHFRDRIAHALSFHRGKGFRRHAMLGELAGPLDLEVFPVSPRWLWLMALASPLLGVARAVGRKLG